MATTTHEPPHIDPRPRPVQGGSGGFRHRSPDQSGAKAIGDVSPPPSETAVWVGIAAITMSFAAFTSALVVRKGGAPDWHHLVLPPILYANTVVLLISSFTLHLANQRVSAFMKGELSLAKKPALWLQVTLGLGLLFVAGQYVAWLQLRSQGLYVATSPNSSFFYVFTAIHSLHVLGGLIGLTYVIRLFQSGGLRRSTLRAASHYWHFMDALWVYLLFVLWSKI